MFSATKKVANQAIRNCSQGGLQKQLTLVDFWITAFVACKLQPIPARISFLKINIKFSLNQIVHVDWLHGLQRFHFFSHLLSHKNPLKSFELTFS
jgi:hypothetical protein